MIVTREIKIGDYVKSFDFEPMEGREDRYVIGRVIDIDCGRLTIEVTFDSTDFGRTIVETSEHMIFGEYEGRITKVA